MANHGDFIAWLEDQLKERGWSMADLSRESGLSDGHISYIFSRQRKAGTEALEAIAKALRLPIEYVFRQAGLLPPTKEELDELELEWDQIFSNALSDQERKELLERARFELQRIRERRARYDTDKRQRP